ncbi:putative transmembrane protein [Toxoplasma gondii RUB]|uniref:Putative transmembrane protein n=1 Tax=Toxoplasma gondii RUB TaxID=935652 RepID=A0A086LU89_TOXGO|nr:putative transmembrane protein [Toxoplasma gondii RUB]
MNMLQTSSWRCVREREAPKAATSSARCARHPTPDCSAVALALSACSAFSSRSSKTPCCPHASVALTRKNQFSLHSQFSASRLSPPGTRRSFLLALCFLFLFGARRCVSSPSPVDVTATAPSPSPPASPAAGAVRNDQERVLPSVDRGLVELLAAYRSAEEKRELSAADRDALFSLLIEVADANRDARHPPSSEHDFRASFQGETGFGSLERGGSRPRQPSSPRFPEAARGGDDWRGSGEEGRRSWGRDEEGKEREREARRDAGKSTFPAALVFVCICVSSLLVFVVVRLETKAMMRGGKRSRPTRKSTRTASTGSDEGEESDSRCREENASLRGRRAHREATEREGNLCGLSAAAHGSLRRRRLSQDREERERQEARVGGCMHTNAVRSTYPLRSTFSDIEEERSMSVSGSERGSSSDWGRQLGVRRVPGAASGAGENERETTPGFAKKRGAGLTGQEPFPDQADGPFAASGQPPRPTAQVEEKQQTYEDLCTQLFCRLAALVPASDPHPASQAKKAPEKETEGDSEDNGDSSAEGAGGEKGDKAGAEEDTWRGEAAKREAGEVLSAIDRMLKDIEKDFRTNRAALVTCMIRCCNTLLRLDGLTLLSRCRNEVELRDRAQKVIETVVPCIWSS